MDRKLIFNQDNLNKVITDFNALSQAIDNINFEIWTEIPENFKSSYYKNEELINPEIETFEKWETKLSKRPSPIYSVAVIGNEVISSIYGAEVYNERNMNLWATNSEYRQMQIGKAVLLNFIKYVFENNQNIPIKAWDITTEQVDKTLLKLGFK